MYTLSEGAVQVVAQGTRDTIDQLDAAFEAGLRTMADAIAGLRSSGVPAGRVQHLHDNMIESFQGFGTTRKNIIKAVGHLQLIQNRSDQAETAAGCPMPWNEFFTTGALQRQADGSTQNAAATAD